MSNQILNPQKVHTIFYSCLFEKDENFGDHVAVEGITMTVGFHPGRLQAHKAEIEEMLGELPSSFQMEQGGGMSFLLACYDKDGNQWTSLHQIMEKLFLLGMGIGRVECILSREFWTSLPGGMPYYVIN